MPSNEVDLGLVHLTDDSVRTIRRPSLAESVDNKIAPEVEPPGQSNKKTQLSGAPVSTSPSIIYEGDSYSLNDLLASHQVVSAVLLRDTPKPQVGKLYERLWTALAVFSFAWGVIAALSFTVQEFPLTPSAATFGVFATVGLVLTLRKLGRAES